jgi:hypothetical protein
MLGRFFAAKPTTEVCLTLQASFDRMELVELNPATGELLHIGSIGFEGNPSNKSIANIEAFEEQLKLLLDQSGVNQKAPFRVVLPSLYTRVVNRPDTAIDDDELEPLLQLECENFFLFKKTEPAVAWAQAVAPEQLLLAGYPKVELDRLLQVFEHLKLTVVGVELNYTSLVKGIISTQLLTDEMESDLPWVLLVVQENVFFMASLQGERFVKTFEAPLSRGQGAESHWLNDISQDYAEFTAGAACHKLVLVNNTLQLSSELLLKRLAGVPPDPVVLEQNALTVASLGATEPRYPCTLESMGSSLLKAITEMTTLDFLPKSLKGQEETANLQATGLKVVIALNVAVVLIVFLGWASIALTGVSKTYELDQMTKQPSMTQTLTLENAQLVQRLFVAKALLHNKRANDFVINTAINLPDTVWLDVITVAPHASGTDATLQRQLQGGSLTPEDVNNYLGKLNQLLAPPAKPTPDQEKQALLLGEPLGQALPLLEVTKLDVSPVNTAMPNLPPFYQWVMQTKAPAPEAAAPAAAAAPAPAPPVKGATH